MPFRIFKRKGAKKPFVIVHKNSGKIVGKSITRSKAQAAIRARLANEPK